MKNTPSSPFKSLHLYSDFAQSFQGDNQKLPSPKKKKEVLLESPNCAGKFTDLKGHHDWEHPETLFCGPLDDVLPVTPSEPAENSKPSATIRVVKTKVCCLQKHNFFLTQSYYYV
jgi:hypothetical protein